MSNCPNYTKTFLQLYSLKKEKYLLITRFKYLVVGVSPKLLLLLFLSFKREKFREQEKEEEEKVIRGSVTRATLPRSIL